MPTTNAGMHLTNKSLSLGAIHAAEVITVFAAPTKLTVAKHKVKGEKPHLLGMSSILRVFEVGDEWESPVFIDRIKSSDVKSVCLILPPCHKRRKSSPFNFEKPFAHSISQAKTGCNLRELIRLEVELAWDMLNVHIVKAI